MTSRLADAARRFGLGLRAQIVLALSVAFVVSFPLLGIAAVQLTQRARSSDRVRDAQVTARAVVAGIEAAEGDRRAAFDRLADSVIGRGGIGGAELVQGDLEPRTRGIVQLGTPVEVPLSAGGSVRLWVRAPDPSVSAPLANLLLLYLAVTAGGIMLLAYLVLTYLIVRPVEGLTRASERLAAGGPVDVPIRGAAEVARLALSFNEMAKQLRADREALQRRLVQLEETTAELESAQEQVVRSARLAAVGRLAAGVAHEIGNPLTAILGLVELLRDGDLPADEQQEFLHRIQGETERIHKIIRDLLDFSRRQPEEDKGTADLAEVVADAVRLVTPLKDVREVTIERRFAEDLPRVRGSADRLTQVVLNLLLNAADAISDEGSITIEVRPAEDRGVALEVTDSGPGLSQDALEHLFEPFYTTKPTGKGTGLGLAVSLTIVEQVGGTIEADTAPGGGARFIVTLPAATESAADDGHSSEPP